MKSRGYKKLHPQKNYTTVGAPRQVKIVFCWEPPGMNIDEHSYIGTSMAFTEEEFLESAASVMKGNSSFKTWVLHWAVVE